MLITISDQMKIIIFILISICVISSLTSCFKRNEKNVNASCTDSCMTFNVRVSTGLNSATPVSNSFVELGWSKPAIPLGDPGRLIANGKTSADGFISFSFKALPKEIKGGGFYVRCLENNDYFSQQNTYDINKFDSIVNANVHVPSKATLKIVYKNFVPTNSNDCFQCLPLISTYGSNAIPVSMKKPDGQLGNTFFFANEGPFSILELTGTTAGNQYTYFNILKKKNGVRIDLRDSIYIEKGQTKTYEIEF